MFNEAEWVKLIFLLADTQQWIDAMVKQAIGQVPVSDKKKFLQQSYYLSVVALAHILERHYYKIPRYPHTGKFHIPVADILQYIRQAFPLPVSPVSGSINFQRLLNTGVVIGFDRSGQPTTFITILTNAGGRIITAFPGHLSVNDK